MARGLLCIAVLAMLARFAPAQPAQPIHRILIDGNGWLLEEVATGTKRPFDMWTIRLANAAMHTGFTDDVIANLDDYKRYGLNTLVVSLQGGNSEAAPYPRVYNSDGSLDLSSVVWSNMRRLLGEADKRGMVISVQLWYFLRDENVPNDADALIATQNATQWLSNTGYENYIFDIANEFLHGAYGSRPLFKTLDGALELIDACRSVDQGAILGISPPNRLFFPGGTLSNPTRSVSADYIIAHNTVLDPQNAGSYRLSTKPADPSAYPYVNNEFWSQIPYERTKRTNPRTGLDDYGHFSPVDVANYLADLQKVVGYGGTGNVHARRLQHVTSTSPTGYPVAVIGPAGTQPEATSGAGEPSLHWVFRGIARIRRFGPLPTFLDFNDGYAAGVETDLGGAWSVSGGYLRQTDENRPSAFARLVADEDDVEISVDLGISSTPTAVSAVGLQIGSSSETGPAWRLRAFRDRVVLDRVGVSSTPQTAFLPKLFQDQYVLRLRDGRVQVRAAGVDVFDVADDGAVTERNVFLLTENAAGRFDNVRVTPLRVVDFEDQTTGDWTAAVPAHWQVASRGAGSAWRAGFGSGTSVAHLNQKLEDFTLSFETDLSNVGPLTVVARSPDATAATPEGYLFDLHGNGSVAALRRDATGLTTLATGLATGFNPASMQVALVVSGNRLIASIDGTVIVDVVDPDPRLPRGDVGLLAHPGTTWFDDLDLRVGPGKPPVARFRPFTGPAFPLGFTIEVGDPDGILDVADLGLAVDTGSGFVDISFVLIPTFSVFGFDFTNDGRSLLFDLKAAAPLSNVDWTFRIFAVDRAGKRSFQDLRVVVP